jgi:hypothetical protein
MTEIEADCPRLLDGPSTHAKQKQSNAMVPYLVAFEKLISSWIQFK